MKRLITEVLGIFLAIAGLVGVVVQLVTTPGRLGWGSLLFLFVVLTLLGLWLVLYSMWKRHRTSRALPQINQLDDLCIGYRVTPATTEDIDWIARQEQEVYVTGDAVPRHVLAEWYEANPSGFSVIKMPNGERIGHLDILPVRPKTLAKFIEGNIVERDIRGDSLYSSAERAQIRDLYVESIAVLPPKKFSNAPAILCILTTFGSVIGRICEPTSAESVYAIAASKSGEGLLDAWGSTRSSLRRAGSINTISTASPSRISPEIFL